MICQKDDVFGIAKIVPTTYNQSQQQKVLMAVAVVVVEVIVAVVVVVVVVQSPLLEKIRTNPSHNNITAIVLSQ